MRSTRTSSTLKRITVTGTVAVLAAGVGVPAFAGVAAASGSGHHDPVKAAPTVDELKMRVDLWIDAKLRRLAEADARVSASTDMTAEEKAAWHTKIATKTAALTTLKGTVDAATTKEQVKAALSDYRLAQFKTRVDTRISKKLDRLAETKAKIAASTTLNDAQKAAATARIDAQVAALAALKTKVDAATTWAGVVAALKSYEGRLGWFGDFDARHHDPRAHKSDHKTDHKADHKTAPKAKASNQKANNQKARSGKTGSRVSVVSVHTSGHAGGHGHR
jgi:hypothetical protein